jgi:hypothetical protein
MGAWDSEHRHHRVPDEFLDGSAVTLDDGADLLEVAAHGAAQALGIESLAERRRAGDVAEENGHRLPDVPRGRLGGQFRATGSAELEPVRIFPAAGRTFGHA